MCMGFILCLYSVANAQQKPDNIHNGKELVLSVSDSGITNNEVISKKTLMKAKRILCSDANYMIVSFVFTADKDGGAKTLSIMGNNIPKEIKKDIKRLESGQKICIDNVNARTPDGKVIRLSSKCYTIE